MHEARRLRREDKLDDALLTLADADASHGSPCTRGAGSTTSGWNWCSRRFGRRQIVVYTQGDGRAAALEQVARKATLRSLPRSA